MKKEAKIELIMMVLVALAASAMAISGSGLVMGFALGVALSTVITVAFTVGWGSVTYFTIYIVFVYLAQLTQVSLVGWIFIAIYVSGAFSGFFYVKKNAGTLVVAPRPQYRQV